MRKIFLVALMAVCSKLYALNAANGNSVNGPVAVNDTIPYGYFEDERKVIKNDTVKNYAEGKDSLNALDYIMDSRYLNPGESFSKRWSDHLFIEVAAGVEQLVPPTSNYHFNALTTIRGSVGKQFDKLSSFRGSLIAGWGYQQDKDVIFLRASAKADYIFDLSSYISGYNPRRMLGISSLIGVGANLSHLGRNQGTASSYDAHAGLQLKFYTGPRGYFTIEPYVGLATDQYDLSRDRNWRRADFFYGASIGYIYYFNNNLSKESRRRLIENKGAKDELWKDTLSTEYASLKDSLARIEHINATARLQSWSQPWFLEFGNGINWLKSPSLRLAQTMGNDVTISVGKWFSPVIGVRMSALLKVTTWKKDITDAVVSPYTPKYEYNHHNVYAGFRLEALFNPLGFSKNFRWDSKFGTHLLLGGEMGWLKKYQEGTHLSTYSHSYTVGLNLWTKLAEGLHLFVEPRYTYYVYKIPFTNVDWDKRFSDDGYAVNVGLRVSTVSKYFRENRSNSSDNAVMPRITAGIGIGTSIIQTTGTYEGVTKLNYNVQAFGEYHLNKVSSARVGFEFASLTGTSMINFYDYNMNNPERPTSLLRKGLWDNRLYFGLLSINYMVNLSNALAGYNSSRKFELEAYAGPVCSMLFGSDGQLNESERLQENHICQSVNQVGSKIRLGANAGLKLKYNLSKKIDLFFSPNLYWVGNMSVPGVNMLRFKYFETINIGAQYKF